MQMTITSKNNSSVKHAAKLLKSAAFRRECGEFLVEGEVLLQEALAAGYAPLEVFFDPERINKDSLSALPKGTPCLCCDGRVIAAISSVETPQGIVARLPMKESRAIARKCRKLIVLDDVRDPGNMGTILRTADAFAIDGVILCGTPVDVYNPKVVRATMGAIFRLPVFHMSREEASAFVKERQIPLYAAVLSPDAADARLSDLSQAAVIIGNEAAGVSKELIALADGLLRLPMGGHAESLNASVAASIFMWEMSRA